MQVWWMWSGLVVIQFCIGSFLLVVLSFRFACGLDRLNFALNFGGVKLGHHIGLYKKITCFGHYLIVKDEMSIEGLNKRHRPSSFGCEVAGACPFPLDEGMLAENCPSTVNIGIDVKLITRNIDYWLDQTVRKIRVWIKSLS